jgi:predicted transposase/invertase (TIGR01784 family)
MKFVDVKNDVAFHKIFGNANKTVTLISFLNAVLYQDGSNRVVSVTVENPYLFPPVPQGKTSILDVKATDQDGRKFIVELQVADELGFDKRVQYYVARDYANQIERGDDYPKLRPTYLIGILDFDFTQNPSYFSTHQTMDTETGENLLRDVKYFFIELKKFNKQEVELSHVLDKWIYFIKNAQNLDLIPANVDDEGLRTAYRDADQQTWTKAERDAYDDFGIYLTGIAQRELLLMQQGEQKGMKEGIKEGMKEGELKKETTMIFAMHAAGLPIPQIAAISGRSEDEILTLIARNIG